MADNFLSEIRIFSFGVIPRNWVPCSGQLLPISSNQALFSLVGTTYGGDGKTTFGLPNLLGRVPMHVSSTGTTTVLGQSGGETTHTLQLSEIPVHNHFALASSNGPNTGSPSNSFWATGTGFSPYSGTKNESMSANALSNTGSGQPHQNMAPYLTLNICIALQGIFPSPN